MALIEDTVTKDKGANKKIAKIPVWGWALGLGLIGGGVFYWWKRRGAVSGSSSTSTTTSTASATTSTAFSSSQYSALQDQILELQGELSTGFSSIQPTTTGTTTGTSVKVTVPTVVGDSYTAASAKLKANGLNASRGSATYVGTVTISDPKAGTKVDKGSTVVLTGKKKVTVPNVVGLSYTAAAAKLAAVGLDASRGGKKDVGTVAQSNPGAGSKVETGSTVTLLGKNK